MASLKPGPLVSFPPFRLKFGFAFLCFVRILFSVVKVELHVSLRQRQSRRAFWFATFIYIYLKLSVYTSSLP